MGKLRPVRHADLEKFVRYVGCSFKWQKGSHRIYTRAGLPRPIVIPAYDEVPIFIIRNILRALNLSVDDYLRIRDLF
jgi:predicted RNA binding protein YcfA (HicA-like mRNA interferase family)